MVLCDKVRGQGRTCSLPYRPFRTFALWTVCCGKRYNYACIPPCLVSLSRGIKWNHTFILPYTASVITVFVLIKYLSLREHNQWLRFYCIPPIPVYRLTASPDIRHFKIFQSKESRLCERSHLRTLSVLIIWRYYIILQKGA